MIPYIGDFAEDATIYHYFNTFDSNDPSASVTITNLADTDIYVYKDGSVTDIVTDGASVVIDFDSRTGVHKLTIDTSVHADYAVGSDYMVLIEGTTVDAGTVTAGIFTFSIENRYNAAADDLANGTDGLGALKALIDTLTTNVATVDTVVDGIQTDLDNGTDGLGAIKADTAAILVDTADIQPNYATAAALATVDTVVDGIQTDLSNATDGLGAIKADTAAILVDTADIQPNYATAAALSTVDTVVDGIQTDLSNATDGLGAIKADTAAILTDTADIQPNYATAAALTTVDNEIAALQTDLDTLTDTSAEPTGVPAASATLLTKVGYLYMALRNQVDVTATKKTFYGDDGVAEWEKDLSDDTTTYSESEGNAI